MTLNERITAFLHLQDAAREPDQHEFQDVKPEDIVVHQRSNHRAYYTIDGIAAKQFSIYYADLDEHVPEDGSPAKLSDDTTKASALQAPAPSNPEPAPEGAEQTVSNDNMPVV